MTTQYGIDIVPAASLPENNSVTDNPDQYYGYIIENSQIVVRYSLPDGRYVDINIVSKKPNDIPGKCIGPVVDFVATISNGYYEEDMRNNKTISFATWKIIMGMQNINM